MCPQVSLVWADVLGQAWLNARPVARYLALMVVAGVIASYGVIETNTILIVGAMAVSPDLLPITAIGVGILGRRGRLVAEASLTLIVGLAVAAPRRAGERGGAGRFDAISSGAGFEAAVAGRAGRTTVKEVRPSGWGWWRKWRERHLSKSLGPSKPSEWRYR